MILLFESKREAELMRTILNERMELVLLQKRTDDKELEDFISKIFSEIKKAKPDGYLTAMMNCETCGFAWVAVYPAKCKVIECKVCKTEIRLDKEY